MRRGAMLIVAALLAGGCGNFFTDSGTRVQRCMEQQREQYPGRYTQEQLEIACTRFESEQRLGEDGSIKPRES